MRWARGMSSSSESLEVSRRGPSCLLPLVTAVGTRGGAAGFGAGAEPLAEAFCCCAGACTSNIASSIVNASQTNRELAAAVLGTNKEASLHTCT